MFAMRRFFRLRMKLILAFAAIIVIALILSANDSEPESNVTTEGLILSTTKSETTTKETLAAQNSQSGAGETYIILADDMTTINGKGASFSDGQVTVTKGGTYVFKGGLRDGRICVDLEDEAQQVVLKFYGVAISSSRGAPVAIENSTEDTVIHLAKGTVNFFSDTAERAETYIDTREDTAVIYSRDDLIFEGDGTINVTAGFNKGIFSKKDITLKGANINIISVDDGIRSNDSIVIEKGKLSITAGGDGIRTADETRDVGGKIVIHEGDISITSELEGVQSEGDILFYGGRLDIITAGGSTGRHTETFLFEEQNNPHKDKNELFSLRRPTPDSSAMEEFVGEKSAHCGIYAKGEIVLSDAGIKISSVGDAICGESIEIENGHYVLQSDDDGLHAEDEVEIDGGDINITDSYEGIEGKEIELSGGKIIIKSFNNGFNTTLSDVDYGVEIEGAYVHVDSDGRGFDAKAKINVTDGTLIVFDSAHSDSASDLYNISSGTLLVLCDTPIARNVTGEDMPVIAFTQEREKNMLTVITDSKGKGVIGFSSPKKYRSVVFASDLLGEDEYYNLYGGGTFRGEALNGVYTSGDYSKGELLRKLSKPLINLDKTG